MYLENDTDTVLRGFHGLCSGAMDISRTRPIVDIVPRVQQLEFRVGDIQTVEPLVLRTQVTYLYGPNEL